MGRAPALLTGRVAAFCALAAALAVYYSIHGRLWNESLWPDIAFLGFLLIPAVFGLVYLALPLWRSPPLALFVAGLGFVGLAVAFEVAGAKIPANFSKLAAMTALAWVFLYFFEDAAWVVLVAVIVPWVDAYSVWRGPTQKIVTHHEHVFTLFSFAFPVPGENSAAKLGLPDLLFFALFLGAAARFRLRVGWTWFCLTASIGTTMALATWLAVNGLPALPLLALGFLLPNADLLWRAVQRSIRESSTAKDRAATDRRRDQR